MVVVVEPVVTDEKLRQLLAEQHESAELDYKATLDLSKTRDKVGLAKDVGAMAMRGGFVVGADDRGQPTGQLSQSQAELLDEARLRGMLERYVPASIEVRSAVHELDGGLLAVVYVGPHPDALAVFKADGRHEDPSDSSRQQTVFRAGEVFARHGSRSERWNQDDVAAVRRRLIEREKEAWSAQFTEDLRRTGLAAGGRSWLRALLRPCLGGWTLRRSSRR